VRLVIVVPTPGRIGGIPQIRNPDCGDVLITVQHVESRAMLGGALDGLAPGVRKRTAWINVDTLREVV
jgi:hypothetical protein